jgi:hypothetical protein
MTGPARTTTLVIAAAAIALGSPAVATAEPKEWDIGTYDQCVRSFSDDPNASAATHQRWKDHMKMCCDKSGGVYQYSGQGGCVAPPKEQAEVWRPPGGLPAGTLTPIVDLPPGVITPAP